MIKLEYKDLCPNCGNRIDSERLELGLPCKVCLPDINQEITFGRLYELKKKRLLIDEIDKAFEKILKTKMWALQRFWVRRFLEEESFTLIAPTGSGKTTMQVFLSIYSAWKMKKRCLILLPTSILVHQVSQKLNQFKEVLNANLEIAYYHSLLKGKEKKEQLQNMNGADIIVTTHLSVMKREEINKQKVDVVFVDDVDSFLRRSKSVFFVLKMMKLPKKIGEIIDEVFERKIEIKEALETIESIKKKSKIKSQIIVSGATQTARRTKSVKLLNKIFDFSIGGRTDFGRKIVDSYLKPNKSLEETVEELVKKLGKGGLIFVPSDKGAEFGEKLEKYLEEKGLKVKSFFKAKKEYFEMFSRGEIDALIGAVTLRSPLVRGIDLPHIIRYAIFVGVPKFLVRINLSEFHPTKWLMLLNNISSAIKEEYRKEYENLFASLVKIKGLNKEQLEIVRNALNENKPLEGFLEYVRNVAIRGMEFFKNILKDEDIIKAIKESPTISFGVKENEYYFLVTDEVAYIQASGRVSRLYVGGLTKGLSIVIIDDEKAFNSLTKELKYFEEIEWKNFEELKLDEILKEIDQDRRNVILAMEGKLEVREAISLKTVLFIVESPNKARTIARYFGRPSMKKLGTLKTYEVFIENFLAIITASNGHITDLDLKDGLFGVKIENGFVPVFKSMKRCIKCGKDVEEEEEVCPVCGGRTFITSKPRIEALRNLASLVDMVIIGTDPDSEGEKISYDLYLLLKPFNKNIKRARFHEVTKREITKALNNLEDFDINLVKAQIVRRVEDRWIGFTISPILWKHFKNKNLSAGRVQTPVLSWIDERTKKLREKEEAISLTLSNGLKLYFRGKIGTYKEIIERGIIEILKVEKKEVEVNPYPPFTTDTLISALTSSLKINANQAMSIAQKLFENGLITYHRTNSTTVSNVGISIAREYITNNFGETFVKERKWEKEGAHECIRPTRGIDAKKLRNMVSLGLMRFPSPLTEQDYRAYDIIFKRFIASQMKPVKVEKVLITIKAGNEEKSFEFTTRILEDGFNKIVPLSINEISEVKEGIYSIKEIKRKIVQAYHAYTYSEIVSTMKEKGIGRPSTYAKILEVLKRRKYVIEIKKSKLLVSPLGSKVLDFLKGNYWKYLNEDVTRELETKMDLIEEGKAESEDVLKKFYEEIKEIMKNAIQKGIRYNTEFIPV
ncbi:MAG: reverse gyrase [Candidatus Aenigmatarchaeota archaeon]